MKVIRLGDKIKITWPVSPISNGSFQQLAKKVRATTDYSPVYSDVIGVFSATAASIHPPIGLGQAISIRNILLKEKVIKNHHKIHHLIEKIASDYESGTDILNLSIKHDYPPLTLLREILYKIGFDRAQLRKVFVGRDDPRDLLEGRNLQEYKLAHRNDAEGAFNQQVIAEVAADNENAFVDYFRKLGISIKTQNDLVAEQVAERGHAYSTPDLLFLDDVHINGHQVKWIDYKDYCGTPVSFLYESNRAQAAKYLKKWGPGAICYRFSFVKTLTIPGAILLDVSALEGIPFRNL